MSSPSTPGPSRHRVSAPRGTFTRSSRAARMLSQPLPAPGWPCTPPPPHLRLPVQLHPGIRQPPAASLQASGSPLITAEPWAGQGRGGALTWASCSRSSRRVTVMERSQVYFLRRVSCSFRSCSSVSRTSEKNWEGQRGHTGPMGPLPAEGSDTSSMGWYRNHLAWHKQTRGGASRPQDGLGLLRDAAVEPGGGASSHLEIGCVLLQVGLDTAA